MRMQRERFVFGMLLIQGLLCSMALAQDALEPEGGILNSDEMEWSYAEKVRDKLLKQEEAYFGARVIALPSFESEWVLTLTTEYDGKNKIHYVLEYAEAGKSLWDSEKNWKAIPVKRLKVKLDNKIAGEVEDVWRGMLRQVRYPESEPESLDGTSYHFSRAVPNLAGGRPNPEGGFESGQVSSPDPDSVCGKFVKLAEDLRGYVLKEAELRENFSPQLRDDLRQLRKKLDQHQRQDMKN